MNTERPEKREGEGERGKREMGGKEWKGERQKRELGRGGERIEGE